MGKLAGTKIRVTKADIEGSKQGNVNSCAIAHAIKRVTGRTDVFVDSDSIKIGNRNSLCVCEFPPPKKAQDFIDRFDDDKKKARPFEFILRKGKSQQFSDKEEYEDIAACDFES